MSNCVANGKYIYVICATEDVAFPSSHSVWAQTNSIFFSFLGILFFQIDAAEEEKLRMDYVTR